MWEVFIYATKHQLDKWLSRAKRRRTAAVSEAADADPGGRGVPEYICVMIANIMTF